MVTYLLIEKKNINSIKRNLTQNYSYNLPTLKVRIQHFIFPTKEVVHFLPSATRKVFDNNIERSVLPAMTALPQVPLWKKLYITIIMCKAS